MNVTGLAIVPPEEAEGEFKVTPELLASVLARYSRSNDGISNIMSKVDLKNADKSIDRILKFVDYGHASIGGLTGGIAIAIDDVSMWLAYKLFEVSQMCDGQESSTRYITMDPKNIPTPDEIGMPVDLAEEWLSIVAEGFECYNKEYERLDQIAKDDPSVVRAPEGTPEKVLSRMRKNYALDRARYFIPLATKTNLALVMSARMWAQTIKHIASLPQKEAQTVADLIRAEVAKFAPRLVKHSKAEKSFQQQATEEHNRSIELQKTRLSIEHLEDEVWVDVADSVPPFLAEKQSIGSALKYRSNRYGYCGTAIRRMRVAFAWNNMAIAELRDLNRHRTGHRYTPCIQAGFYLAGETDRDEFRPFLERQKAFLSKLAERGDASYVYALMLGSQTPFEHSTHADKFVYEAELRTGLGAHYRYADHLSQALAEFYKQVPDAREWVVEGTAEPE
ncbi:FAD-dependent thymidylate synthase [Pelagicoccus mobilis]|uniref:FAD-dependent thymidylate synthase n=1 Tax=Pelagicoccus mobilis TaxID=415221 RepID=A0A934RZG8_9BACT|nr:FAD-dependent thymidylate synthase [Pelagicoccus mobilis]MBK1878385.1 FAD-dependent thymidylate synthase [Pelagicoccus mobilis]